MSKTPLVAGEAPGAYGAAAPPAGGALPATMKGTYITEYGDNSVLKLGELPMPVVEDGWVLVRVHAASLVRGRSAVKCGALVLATTCGERRG